jgi:hypothetical protein
VENSGKWQERKNKSERNESAKKNHPGAAQSQGKSSQVTRTKFKHEPGASQFARSCLIAIDRGSVAS